jgi:ABC transporter DrrB family efflux protein
MSTGLIDRFRSLPMASGAVLIGRTFADAARQILVLLVLSITGLLVGWRITGGFWNAVGAYALLLLFAYAVSWVGAYIGLSMRSVETASTAGLIWLFPLTFLSNAFVPISSMPTWLQTIASYNPISTLVLATRELFGNPTGIQPDYWPMNNPVLYTIGSCLLVVAIFATISIRKYKRTTAK